MIPGLDKVTHIISHKNCPDGIASALICKAALPNAKVSFVMYGEDSYENFMLPCDRSEAMDLWVDIIPPKARAQAFADWQTTHVDWNEACAQAEALTFYGFDHFKSPWLSEAEQDVGLTIVRKRRAESLEQARNAYHVGMYAFTNTRYASDFAEALRELGDPAQVAFGFFYVGQPDGSMQLVYSMRTIGDGTVDVAATAKANGGGGHTKAAGFSIPCLIGSPNPVDSFMRRVG